jgi:hypothetical protein
MEALSAGGRLLDEAKNKALEIADACKPSDLFQLLTTDFEGRHQRFVSRDEFRNLVEEVKISPAVQVIGRGHETPGRHVLECKEHEPGCLHHF